MCIIKVQWTYNTESIIMISLTVRNQGKEITTRALTVNTEALRHTEWKWTQLSYSVTQSAVS